jgi:hypothetical protein
MAEQVHTRLFYTPSVEAPERFFELRCCAHQVWTAEGSIYTHGEDTLVVCGSPHEAEQRAAELAAGKATEGFALARTFSCAADRFDYAAFTVEVTRGIEAFWRNINALQPSKHFDRLAISTDDDAMTISAFVNQAAPDDEDHILYNPQEWPTADTHELEIAYRMMLSKHRDIPFEKRPPRYDDSLLESMIRALENARRKSLLPDTLLLWVDISDSAQIAGMYARLNTKPNATKLKAYFGDDADRRLKPHIK